MASFNHARVSLLIVGAVHSCACSGGAQGEGKGELYVEADTASAQVEVTCAASNEHLTDLGVLDPTHPSVTHAATALNNHGTVVGFSSLQVSWQGSFDLTVQHAFRWKADTGMVDLGTLGGVQSFAVGVNDADEVAGSASLPDDDVHAAVWDAQGRIRDLGTLGGRGSRASGINNRGQVVGTSTTLREAPGRSSGTSRRAWLT
ncbi:MAG: hypothetical protein WDO74_01955 [Pseudomonadota bacterium]